MEALPFGKFSPSPLVGPETASLQDQIRINTCHIILRLLCTECPSQIPPQALALARCMVVEVAEARADNPHGGATSEPSLRIKEARIILS